MGKSQVSLYVIIGLAVVFAIGFLLAINAQQRSQDIASVADSRSTLDAERLSLDYYIEGCVRQTVIDAEIKHGLHRVWAAPEIENYIEDNLGRCLDDFRYFKERGYLVNKGNLDAKVEISREAVAVTIDLPVYLKKGDMEITYDSRVYRLPLTTLERLNLNGETRIVSSDGTLILEIPEGTEVTVNGQKVDQVGMQLLDRHFNTMSNSVVAGMLAFNGIPHKATFSKPVKVTKYYQENDIPIYVREEELRLGTYDSDVGIWVGLPTVVDPVANKITTYITHFSQMATVKNCDDTQPAQVLETNTIVRQDCTGCEETWIKEPLGSESAPVYAMPKQSLDNYEIEGKSGIGIVSECLVDENLVKSVKGYMDACKDKEALQQAVLKSEVKTFDECKSEICCPSDSCITSEVNKNDDCACNPKFYEYEKYYEETDKLELPEFSATFSDQETAALTDYKTAFDRLLTTGKLQGYDLYGIQFEGKGDSCIAADEPSQTGTDGESGSIQLEKYTGINGVSEELKNGEGLITISADYCHPDDKCTIIDPKLIIATEEDEKSPEILFGYYVENTKDQTCLQGNAKVEIKGTGIVGGKYFCTDKEAGQYDFVRGNCKKCTQVGDKYEWTDSTECFTEDTCVPALQGIVKYNAEGKCVMCESNGKWNPAPNGNNDCSACSNSVGAGQVIRDITGMQQQSDQISEIDKTNGWSYVGLGAIVVLGVIATAALGGVIMPILLGVAAVGLIVTGSLYLTGVIETSPVELAQQTINQPINSKYVQNSNNGDKIEVSSSRCFSSSVLPQEKSPEQTLTDGTKDCNEAGNVKTYTLLTTSWAQTEDCKGKGCEAGKCKTEAAAEPVKCGKNNEITCKTGETCDPTTKTCKAPSTGSQMGGGTTPPLATPTTPPTMPPPATSPPPPGGSTCTPSCTATQDCKEGKCVDKPKTCIDGTLTVPCPGIDDNALKGKKFTIPGSVSTSDMDFCDTFGSYSGQEKFEIISTAELAGACFVKVHSIEAIEGVNRDWYLKFDDIFSAILSCDTDSDCGGNYECRNHLCYEKKFSLVGIYDVPTTKFTEAKDYGADHLGTYSADNSLGAEDFLRLNDNLFKTSGNKLDIKKVSLNYEDGAAYWILEDICNDEKWDVSITDLTDLYSELKSQASLYVMVNFDDLNCALDYLHLADKPIADVVMFKVDVGKPDDYIGKQSALAETIIKESVDKKIPMKVLPVVDVSEATPAWISKTGEDLLGEKTTGGMSPFSGLLFGPYSKIRQEDKDVLSYAFCKAKELYLEEDCSQDPAELVEEVKVAFVSNLGDPAIVTMIQNKEADLIVLSGNIGTLLSSSSLPYISALGLLDTESSAFSRVPEGMICTGTDGDMIKCKYKGIDFIVSGVGISATSGHEDFIKSSLNDLAGWRVCVWSKNNYLLRTSSKANADTLALKYYDLCLSKGAMIATGYDDSYARTKTITGMSQNILFSGPPSSITLGHNKTLVFNSGLGGMGSERFDCNHGYGYWASVYTSNYYLKNGIDQQKSCTTDAVSNFRNGALFITFNYNENQRKAHGEFITVDNQIIDTFEITREIS